MTKSASLSGEVLVVGIWQEARMTNDEEEQLANVYRGWVEKGRPTAEAAAEVLAEVDDFGRASF